MTRCRPLCHWLRQLRRNEPFSPRIPVFIRSELLLFDVDSFANEVSERDRRRPASSRGEIIALFPSQVHKPNFFPPSPRPSLPPTRL